MNRKYLPDPGIFQRKTAFMQRIADLVRTGHSRYVQGEIRPERVPILAAKFNHLYQCDQTRLQASRMRREGIVDARLLLWVGQEDDQISWILLANAREDLKWLLPESSRQQWYNAENQRIKLTGYELVRLNAPVTPSERNRLAILKKRLQETSGAEQKKISVAYGRAYRASKNRLRWTWRYERDTYESLRHEVIRVIRNRRDDELKTLLAMVWRTPGFSGTRQQVYQLRELVFSEWKRHRGKESAPELPKNIGYVRRLKDDVIPVSRLINSIRKAG